MLDTTDRSNLKQIPNAVVSFAKDAGPHNFVLSEDDSRLLIADYFLNEDVSGIIHFKGDHRVRVVKVTHHRLIGWALQAELQHRI